MKVVGRRVLVEYWSRQPRARGALTAWFEMVRPADWRSPDDIRDAFNAVEFAEGDRVVFGVGGDAYRIVVLISYSLRQVLIEYVGARGDFDGNNSEAI